MDNQKSVQRKLSRYSNVPSDLYEVFRLPLIRSNLKMTISILPLSILIVEDHALLADGIRNLLDSQPRYRVVGAVSNGLAVYEACQRLSPDLVLLDLGLPGMDGVDVIRQLRRWNDMRIVVVTASSEARRGSDALAAGALAYVLKQSPQQTLLAAMQHASLGKTFVDPALRLDSWRPLPI